MKINFDKYTDKGQYKVPEGYFDTLTDRIMANIPEKPVQQRKARIISLTSKVKYAIAACFVAAVIGGTTYQLYKESNSIAELEKNAASTPSTITYDEEYVNDYMDYAMIDGNDIYEYLSEQ